MNWVTTNIRFPEDLYMELRMEAARRRKSVASIVREKLAKKKPKTKKNVKKLMKKLDKLSIEIARQNPGLNLTQALIDMRYEQ